jgi:uncharacterized membrane protein YgdD (TMEM256/DUF423 family)
MSSKNVYGEQFCSPDEQQISTLGTGYIANYASGGGARQAGATLTNKRIYFSGTVYTRNSKGHFVSYKQRKIVNTRDVTGTGYDFYRPLHLVLWGILLLVLCPLVSAILSEGDGEIVGPMLVVGILLFVGFIIAYFVKRMTLLYVEYAGGNIAFNVKWIQKHEQDDFIRNIHLVKDKLYSTAAVAQGFFSEHKETDEIPEL